MAIKIQTKKTSIPVELGDLKFGFDVTDESIKKFRENAIEIQKELAVLDINDDNALDVTKDILKRGYDLILGDGAFDKVYEMSPSVVIVMDYFVQIIEGIGSELKKMGFNPSAQEKARKYLSKKR